MTILLTQKIVEKIEIPEGRQRMTVSDLMCSGLSLEIRRPNKSGSWRFRFISQGKQRLITLGRLNEVSLTEARRRVFEIKDGINSGIVPCSTKGFKLGLRSVTFLEFVDN